MRISLPTYLKVVRVSGWYDLFVTLPFATPWTYLWIHNLLGSIAQALGLSGSWPVPTPMDIMFANLMGSVVVMWSLARIMQSSLLLGRLDGAARVLFAAWQVNAVLSGASTLLLFFTLVEIIFGIPQLWFIKRKAQSQPI